MKTALIAGGSGRIGSAVAETLAHQGYQVALAARRTDIAERTAQRIRTVAPSAELEVFGADLSLMTDVAGLAKSYLAAHPAPDVLVLCAGHMYKERNLTSEGTEMSWAGGYLGRYYLSRLLLEAASQPSATRVVNVSGGAAFVGDLDRDNLQGERKYVAMAAVKTVAIANDVLAVELLERYGAYSYAYGPGAVRGTGFTGSMPSHVRIGHNVFSRLAGSSVADAAADIVALATGENASGLYQRKLKRFELPAFVADPQQRKLIWQESEDQVAQIVERPPAL